MRLDRVVTVVDAAWRHRFASFFCEAERVLAEGQRWKAPQSAEEELQLAQLSVADLVLLNKALEAL